MKKIKQKAFTLVELLVVVTILAILSTIGFISYTSYLPSVRDSSRLEEIGIIRDNLEKYRLSNKLPLPDDGVEVLSNGTIIGYQGYVGETVLNSIGFQDGGKDPQDKVYYSYYITKNKKYFQLLTFLEENDLLTNLNSNLLTKANAGGLDYTNRYIKVTGSKLGILTDSGSNSPIQEIDSIISAGNLDIGTTTDDYIAHISDTQTIGGDGTVLEGSLPKASCKRIKEIGGDNGDGVYRINPTGSSEITVYCDMSTDGGGWTLVATLDNKTSLASATWLDSEENISGLGTIRSIVDASVSNIALQSMRPTEFRWHPGDSNNNINLNHYFYIKPDYDIDYTKLFKGENPTAGSDTLKHTWYWTDDGGVSKWIGRTNFEKHYIMYHRDGTSCNGEPCGVFDFDITSGGSSNLVQWARTGESWGSYMGRVNSNSSFSCGQDTSDTNYNVNFGSYNGKFCDGSNSNKFTNHYSQGEAGLGLFVR